MRIEEANIDKWDEYANDLLVEWGRVMSIKQEWKDNPNPTAEFTADIRIRMGVATDDLVDAMRPLILCEGELDAELERFKKISIDKANEDYSSATQANSLYKSYEPYNTALEVYNKVKNIIRLSYAKQDSSKNLTNALSTRTREVYQGSFQEAQDNTDKKMF